MAVPANPVATISPAEMQILVSRAGLVLNPGQVADLVLAWRQVAGLIASLPHDRPMADDLAYTFRLPPPAGGTRPAAAPAPARKPASPSPARKPAPAARKRAAAKKPAPKPKAKRASTRPAGKAKARPSAKRGR